MVDKRSLSRWEEAVLRPPSTRRTFLAAASVTTGFIAGCTDAGPGSDEESHVADPETIEEGDTGTAEEEAETQERDESEEETGENPTHDGTDGETQEEIKQEADEESEEVDDESDEERDEDTVEESDEAEETALDHPSARNMSHSPVLGPEPTSGEATVIMFDDPSCPACAYFEENAFPDLKNHADADELSIVWRGIPVIEDWSGAALQVLWATYERDVDTFWDLRAHAFEIQGSVESDGGAVDRLIDHLAEMTSLDIRAIRSEAEDAAYERRMDLNEDAGARAGLDATPYFFLFRNGELRTEIRGAEDYRVFENALEL